MPTRIQPSGPPKNIMANNGRIKIFSSTLLGSARVNKIAMTPSSMQQTPRTRDNTHHGGDSLTRWGANGLSESGTLGGTFQPKMTPPSSTSDTAASKLAPTTK